MIPFVDGLSPVEVLGLTIIGEARGEPIEGQVAVACVIRNRLYGSPHKYQTYKDVCFEKLQFSCWNSNDPNYAYLLDLAQKLLARVPINDIYLKQCFYVAFGVANWDILDNTKGSQYYMTRALFESDKKPSWARPKTMLSYGKQVFFTV